MSGGICLIFNIAGFNIQINFHKTEWEFAKRKFKKDILDYYSGFIVAKTKQVDYKIDIVERRTLEVLLRKKAKKRFINIYEEIGKNSITTFYQISLIQLQLILRDILEKLLTKHQGFIIHASAVGQQGKAILFTGKNFAGKSTAMKLLHPRYKALADDTVIIKKESRRFFVYQTPFIEKEHWVKKSSERYLLEKVCFLRKAKFFKLEKITDKNYILSRLLKQFWTEGQFAKRQLKYLMQFISKFNEFYFLYFAKSREKLIKLLS